MSLEQRHKEVQQWLEELHCGEVVPSYEVNSRTVDLLYKLMTKNKLADNFYRELDLDLQQKTEEYDAEANRLSGILQRFGVGTNALSRSGMTSVDTLAQVALLLEVDDTSESRFLLALTELGQERMKVDDQLHQEMRNTEVLVDKVKTSLIQLGALKKSLQMLEEQAKGKEAELQQRVQNISFLQSKTRKYYEQAQLLQEEFDSADANPSIHHGALLKRSQELKSLKDKLRPVRAKLDSYHKLPPDVNLAKVKVAEMKQELASLEEELSQHLNLLHL